LSILEFVDRAPMRIPWLMNGELWDGTAIGETIH